MSAVVKAVKKVVKAVTKVVSKVVNAVVNTVKDVIAHPVEALVAVAGQAVGIPAPVTYNSIRTAEQGGSLLDVAAAATISYVAPKVASQIGATISPTVSSAISNPAVADAVTNATSKALVNGTIAAATGGDFAQAAAGTMVGSLSASGYQNLAAPSVIAQAQDLGLSLETATKVSQTFGTGIAAGTASTVAGGDFASGFANAVANQSVDLTQQTAFNALDQTKFGQELKSATQNVSEKITTALVDQVPLSPNAKDGTVIASNGNTIGTISPTGKDDAYDQVVAAFEAPRSAGVGAQLSQPTAALTSIEGQELSEAGRGTGDVTEEALFPGSGFRVGVNQTAGPIQETTVDGKTYLTRTITDSSGTRSYYFDPTDQKVTTPSTFFDPEKGLVVVGGKPEPATAAETMGDILETITTKSPTTSVRAASADVPEIDSELPKTSVDQSLSDLQALYKASTGTQISAPAAIKPNVEDARKKLDEAQATYSTAVATATVAPTPENTQLVQDAQANLELNQKMYDDAVSQTSLSTEAAISAPTSDVTGTTFTPQPGVEGTPTEITGGAGTQIVQQEPTDVLPSDLGGDVSAITDEGAIEGQLPPVEVVGEPTYEGQEFPISITGEPTGTEEDQTQYAGQQFPVSITGEPTGVAGGFPTVTYNYYGSPEYRRYLQRRRMRSPLAAASDQSGNLGDLGSGLVWTGQPIDWLQPSVLARGGLVRFKKV